MDCCRPAGLVPYWTLLLENSRAPARACVRKQWELPATTKKLVMVHMWLRIETMTDLGNWEADLQQHTDEDLTWEQITSLDKDSF